MLRRRILERGKQDEIYPVLMTGPNSFILDGQEYTGKPQAAGKRFGTGERAYVGFAAVGRRQPVILVGTARQHSATNSPHIILTQFALWPQSGGNPYNANGPLEETLSSDWTGVDYNVLGSSVEIPRYYWDDEIKFTVRTGAEPDQTERISFEGLTLLEAHPDTGKGRIAYLTTLYDDSGSSIAAYLVREYEIEWSEGGGYTLPFSQTGEWLHPVADPLGTLMDGPRNRCLWYDKSSDTYTAATHEGLLLCTRGNAPTPGAFAWVNTYGSQLGNTGCNMVGRYFLAGAHEAADGTPGDCAINLYQRNTDEHAHVAEVVLTVSGCSHVDGFGFNFAFNDGGPKNHTWPYLDGEWYVWVSGREGDPGPADRPTVAKARLLAIRAAVGTVREVFALDAPLELLEAFDDSNSYFIEQLTYQSEPHPENWVPTGNPGDPYGDSGGANEWVVGDILNGAETSGLIVTEVIPPSDIPATLGGPNPGDYRGFAQEVDVYSEWDTTGDPTVAPESPQLAAPVVVDAVNKRVYAAARQQSWVSSDQPGKVLTGSRAYAGYTDYPSGTIPGFGDFSLRVWRFEQSAKGSFTWSGILTRLWLRVFSSAAMLTERDLTREYTEVDGAGHTIRHRRTPTIYQMAPLGDYLWVLCGDWYDKDTQKLSILLLDKDSLAEVDRVDLSPDEALERLWIADEREPMIVGTDGDGPWVQVAARWTGLTGDPDTWIVQELRYSSGFVRTLVIEDDDENTGPARARAWNNLALSPGRQFWTRTLFNETLLLMRSQI